MDRIATGAGGSGWEVEIERTPPTLPGVDLEAIRAAWVRDVFLPGARERPMLRLFATCIYPDCLFQLHGSAVSYVVANRILGTLGLAEDFGVHEINGQHLGSSDVERCLNDLVEVAAMAPDDEREEMVSEGLRTHAGIDEACKMLLFSTLRMETDILDELTRLRYQLFDAEEDNDGSDDADD